MSSRRRRRGPSVLSFCPPWHRTATGTEARRRTPLVAGAADGRRSGPGRELTHSNAQTLSFLISLELRFFVSSSASTTWCRPERKKGRALARPLSFERFSNQFRYRMGRHTHACSFLCSNVPPSISHAHRLLETCCGSRAQSPARTRILGPCSRRRGEGSSGAWLVVMMMMMTMRG